MHTVLMKMAPVQEETNVLEFEVKHSARALAQT